MTLYYISMKAKISIVVEAKVTCKLHEFVRCVISNLTENAPLQDAAHGQGYQFTG